MGDVFELSIAMDLRGDLSAGEVAELRWHLGLGPMPESPSIVPEFPSVVADDAGGPVVEDRPGPLLGRQGEGLKVPGALVSVLLSREAAPNGGWVMTARQEVHPDEFDRVGGLLSWLATRAGEGHRRSDGSVHVGWIRYYESDRPEPLTVRDGEVGWP
ncbi:hypothetical protein [Saccharothrix sp. ST-888]|uniref:hypothetical protein n=1 Tax=Saccharothrix sp. ST-888 TaxID=1427391 RepID=UPI0005EBFBD6|nr:hypothetical protein [Saccharothrix sp. ST-888]KJK60088.1 hypothetical protein UK12_01345 [Saccharothrix sp. ST-888]